ncbi:unnamed protein product [Rotaria sp. Silwood2]|nr:unnamed protein product [Rotaria sp. Silwood2]CAF3290734.1 unnamed protein product [Rotaria sp. Silwood2]CAF3391800.1 unnamed protein product [Rotaria sp. Silwood2]CAF4068899.1 unnamed protein product [Rotaria sp. Silwood2]CAF4110818.1 unnamed protein product [Rotaria sp. Silwood2]
MSTGLRLLVRKIPEREKESHVIIDSPAVSTIISTRTPLLTRYDYQALRTAYLLAPQSKWIIVRNNIHKIRSWNAIVRTSVVDRPFQNWYILFKMRHELKRAEEEIHAIQYRPNFKPVHHFYLPADGTDVRCYNVSHVQPTDCISYVALGSKPILLQNLLYFFSKGCIVPNNSLFYSFLCDVNSVLDANRKRINRDILFRKVALIITIAVFIIILMMFFSLILSVLTTTSNLRQMYKNGLSEDMT